MLRVAHVLHALQETQQRIAASTEMHATVSKLRSELQESVQFSEQNAALMSEIARVSDEAKSLRTELSDMQSTMKVLV
jgi:predicted  nucleic acid-binding Zn-ribbon protein